MAWTKEQQRVYAAQWQREHRAEHQESMRRYWLRIRDREDVRQKKKARRAVELALIHGCLHRPERCSLCPNSSQIEAHHHLGYAEEHWLDVIWVCLDCHQKLDHPVPRQTAPGKTASP